MKLSDILANAIGKVKQAFQPKELLSPLPDGYVPQINAQAQVAQPTPTPQPVQGRNPNWEYWQKVNPKGFQELLSGAQIAAEQYGVPADLLMDVSGLETSGGTQMNPPKGHTARGYFMFNEPTINDPYLPADVPDNFDPMSATQSAQLAAQLMKKKQLGRWAVAKGKGAGGDSLQDFYSAEELAPFLR